MGIVVDRPEFGRRVVAAVLVGALLLCHGALGSLHEVSHGAPSGAHAGSAPGAPFAGHEGPEPAASGQHHPAGINYAAALFALLSVVLGAGWLRGARERVRARRFGFAPGPALRVAAIPGPSRRPTAPLLQVFRL